MPKSTKENLDNLKNKSIEKKTKASASKDKKATTKTTKEKKATKEVKSKKKVSSFLDILTAKNIIVDDIEVKTRTRKKKKTEPESVSQKEKEKAKLKLYKNINQLIDKSLNKPEYYDLPYSYNITDVKCIAQTPNTLFIYWDLNDAMLNNLKEVYGQDFLEMTKPILKIYNETLNYSFEVEINDFTNSWYLHINNPDSKYRIELGRRPVDQFYFNNVNNKNYVAINRENGHEYLTTNYIFFASSNEIVAPNDHILFESFDPNVLFRNVKTGQLFSKNFSHLEISNVEKLYNIFELYERLYNENDFNWKLNPSSLSSSNMSSSSLF